MIVQFQFIRFQIMKLTWSSDPPKKGFPLFFEDGEGHYMPPPYVALFFYLPYSTWSKINLLFLLTLLINSPLQVRPVPCQKCRNKINSRPSRNQCKVFLICQCINWKNGRGSCWCQWGGSKHAMCDFWSDPQHDRYRAILCCILWSAPVDGIRSSRRYFQSIFSHLTNHLRMAAPS